MTRIYIAYRAADSDVVQRIYDRASQTHGWENIFINPEDWERSDEDSRPLEASIADWIGTCDTILIVVGPHWAGVDEFGRFRLSSADMPLYAELRAALATTRRIVPVCIKGLTTLPPPEVLPEEFHRLYAYPAVILRPAYFAEDLNQFIPPPSPLQWLRYGLSLGWLRRSRLG